MTDLLYMSWRYVAYHWMKSVILVAAIALIVFIPAGLRVLVHQGEIQLRARAQATPLLLGSRDSPLELALNALYFSADRPETMDFSATGDITASGLADAIPVYVRFRSQGDPIVGTTIDYFPFRGLELAAGRQMATLGECVVGATVAADRGLAPGDHVISSPATFFDLAGVYPLKMRVAGVLASSDSPDDHAIFVDLKTAWIIEGLGHGHQDLAQAGAGAKILRRDGSNIVGNAAVREYQEITPDNIGSFHFHRDMATLPITAVIAVPPDRKSRTLLLGRYQSDQRRQLLSPIEVVDTLLATVFSVENVVVAALAAVGFATLALVVLVFMLSLRLRRGEIATMSRIGGSRPLIASILCMEMAGVLVMALVTAGVLTLATGQLAPEVVRIVLSR
ncbi:MAG: ABC transporter permease [Phycisphaerales bacterium]